MMPRSTSVVPPWMVSLGAVFIANGTAVSRISWLRGVRLDEGRQIAHPLRQLLLPDRADVLDDGGFDHRLLAGLQHARDRHRHPAHGVQLRDQPSDALRRRGCRALRRAREPVRSARNRFPESVPARCVHRRVRWSPASRRRRFRRACDRPARRRPGTPPR